MGSIPPTITLAEALRRLTELEAVARMAQPVIASLALRRGDPLQHKAAKVLIQLDALRVRSA